MKFLIIALLVLICLSFGCSSNIKAQNYKNKIKGNWYLNEWTDYHRLIFGDSTVFVDNHVDTVFTLNYKVSNDTLITWNNIEEFKNRIISLDDSTFILDGIHDWKQRIIYTKTFKGWQFKK